MNAPETLVRCDECRSQFEIRSGQEGPGIPVQQEFAVQGAGTSALTSKTGDKVPLGIELGSL